jgi:hypothetical protein
MDHYGTRSIIVQLLSQPQEELDRRQAQAVTDAIARNAISLQAAERETEFERELQRERDLETEQLYPQEKKGQRP